MKLEWENIGTGSWMCDGARASIEDDGLFHWSTRLNKGTAPTLAEAKAAAEKSLTPERIKTAPLLTDADGVTYKWSLSVRARRVGPPPKCKTCGGTGKTGGGFGSFSEDEECHACDGRRTVSWNEPAPPESFVKRLLAYMDAETDEAALAFLQGKPLATLLGKDRPETPARPAPAKGLYQKFNVSRTDGTDAPAGKHHGCDYFVLDLTHDPFAIPAIAAYAAACEAKHPELAADLRNKLPVCDCGGYCDCTARLVPTPAPQHPTPPTGPNVERFEWVCDERGERVRRGPIIGEWFLGEIGDYRDRAVPARRNTSDKRYILRPLPPAPQLRPDMRDADAYFGKPLAVISPAPQPEPHDCKFYGHGDDVKCVHCGRKADAPQPVQDDAEAFAERVVYRASSENTATVGLRGFSTGHFMQWTNGPQTLCVDSEIADARRGIAAALRPEIERWKREARREERERIADWLCKRGWTVVSDYVRADAAKGAK